MKTALIVGGTRGIGKATAEALRAGDWRVVAWGQETYQVHHLLVVEAATDVGLVRLGVLVLGRADELRWRHREGVG